MWQALAQKPNVAVVDSLPVPRKENFSGFGGGGGLDFKLTGFYLEDKTFSPVVVQVNDPQTGKTLDLTIIGVLKDTVPFSLTGISTSQKTVAAAFGSRAEPTTYYIKTAPGVNADAAAKRLESAFLANGMEAVSLKDELHKAVSTSLTFTYIFEGFTGLGLVVGVAALGVISARAVVERRQQIGVLRAIGFQRRMVQLSFLVESSFVAILGIVLGSVLGLILSYNIIADAKSQGTSENITFAVPWLELTVVFLIAYGASLLATFVPARQASRVYPAEALRYE